MNLIENTNEQENHQLVDLIWETIPPVWHLIRTQIRLMVGENFDITIEQFHVMRHINRGVDSISGLAESKQTSRSAMSQAVDGLEEKGLLTRTHDPLDRRYVRLALTQEGAEILHAIFETNRSWMKEKVSTLTQEEIETIIAGLDLLKSTFYHEPENSYKRGR